MVSKWQDLSRNLSDVASDLGDLISKEIRLAKAEVTESVSERIRGVGLLAAAGLAAILALVLLLQGVVLLIASMGYSLHVSCFMVAGALALVAVAIYLVARRGFVSDLAPNRTEAQIRRDVQVLKESFR